MPTKYRHRRPLSDAPGRVRIRVRAVMVPPAKGLSARVSVATTTTRPEGQQTGGHVADRPPRARAYGAWTVAPPPLAARQRARPRSTVPRHCAGQAAFPYGCRPVGRCSAPAHLPASRLRRQPAAGGRRGDGFRRARGRAGRAHDAAGPRFAREKPATCPGYVRRKYRGPFMAGPANTPLTGRPISPSVPMGGSID